MCKINHILIITLLTINMHVVVGTTANLDNFHQMSGMVAVNLAIDSPHQPAPQSDPAPQNTHTKSKVLVKILMETYLFGTCSSFVVFAFILPYMAHFIYDSSAVASYFTLFLFYNYTVKIHYFALSLLMGVRSELRDCLIYANLESYHQCLATTSYGYEHYFYIISTLPAFATFLVGLIIPATYLDTTTGYRSTLVNIPRIAARWRDKSWLLTFGYMYLFPMVTFIHFSTQSAWIPIAIYYLFFLFFDLHSIFTYRKLAMVCFLVGALLTINIQFSFDMLLDNDIMVLKHE